MEIEYDLTIQDLEAFARYQQKHGPGRKPRRLSKVVLWALVLLVLVPLAVLSQLVAYFGSKLPEIDNRWWDAFWCGVFVGLLSMILALWWQGKLVVRSVRRLYDNDESRWIFAPKRMRINADGLSIISEFHRLTCSWAVVCRIGVAADHVFFYTTSSQAHIVPRRAFRDPPQFKAFVDQAREYLNSWDQQGPRSAEILDALPAQPTGITRPHHP